MIFCFVSADRSQDLCPAEERERGWPLDTPGRLVQLRLVSSLPGRDHHLPLPGRHPRAQAPDRDRRLPMGVRQSGIFDLGGFEFLETARDSDFASKIKCFNTSPQYRTGPVKETF